MPTTVTKTIGSVGRDYATHVLWIAGCPSNLVTADQIWAGQSFNDSTFTVTTDILVSGITTDATRYVDLDVGAGQGWVSAGTPVFGAAQSRGVLITTSTTYKNTMVITIDHFKLHNHQITNTGSGRTSYLNDWGGALAQSLIENCIFESVDTAAKVRGGIARNSLSVIRGSNGGAAWDCSYANSGLSFANCGAARPGNFTPGGTAWTASSGTIPMHNCWSMGFTTFSAASRFSGSNNATDLSSVGFGTNNVTSVPFTTATFKVVTDTNHDYALVTGCALLDVGNTDTTDIPAAVDAVGTVRPQGAACDIGPHEFVSSGAAAPIWFGNLQLGAHQLLYNPQIAVAV